MKVVILAGGYGTRISEESHLKPKPMIDIGSKPILWHIMKIYSAFGFNEFVICCGYKGHVIKEYFAQYYLHCSDVTFDFSSRNSMEIHTNIAEPWKVTLVDTGIDTMTGGRIKRIQRYTNDEPFMLTYGDGVGDIRLNVLLECHRSSHATVTLTAVNAIENFGTLDIEDSRRVTRFGEKRSATPTWVNGGFMVLDPKVFEYLENDGTIFERDVLEVLAGKGELGAYVHPGFWHCMDTIRHKRLLDELWESGKAPWMIWK